MKVINASVLSAINTGFSTAFQAGLAMAPSQWNQVATEFPSVTRANDYAWLGEIPGMKKWVGPRQINALKAYKYKGLRDQVIGLDYAGVAIALAMLELKLTALEWLQLRVLERAAAASFNGVAA